jgi:hypothetical protein
MSAAKGKSSETIRTITVGDQSYRELIVPLPANSILGCSETGVCQQISTTSAQLIVVDVTGQVTELSHLVSTLMLVAAGGLLLAFGLGLFLARQALHPLEEVTNEIETWKGTRTSWDACDESLTGSCVRSRAAKVSRGSSWWTPVTSYALP